MKKLLFVLLIGGGMAACSTPSVRTVHLKGQLKNMGSNRVVMRYDGAASLLGDSRDIVLHTDAEGRFDTVVPMASPAYYNISRNTLYLTPGDDLEMTVTTSNREAEFTGKGAVANIYMKKRLFPKGGSFLETGGNVRKDFPATRQVVDSLAEVRRKELQELKGVSDEFKALENARITADIINSYITYQWYAKEFRALPQEEQEVARNKYAAGIKDELNGLYRQITDTTFLDVAVVRDVLGYSTEDQYGWLEGITLPERTRELYDAAGQVSILRKQVTPEVVEQTKVYINNMKNPDFAAEVEYKLAQASRLLPGEPAIDFTLEDVDGNTKKLSDFKGKIIYVDLWATWCGPCIQESPFFESLARKYEDKDVVFLAVSRDEHKNVWKRYLNEHHKDLPQYNSLDPALKNGWDLKYIPRFILIDPDFKIINAYAPRPSEEEAVQLLDSLLNL